MGNKYLLEFTGGNTSFQGFLGGAKWISQPPTVCARTKSATSTGALPLTHPEIKGSPLGVTAKGWAKQGTVQRSKGRFALGKRGSSSFVSSALFAKWTAPTQVAPLDGKLAHAHNEQGNHRNNLGLLGQDWPVRGFGHFNRSFSPYNLGCFLFSAKSLTFSGLMENLLISQKLKS